ncbi:MULTISPECIES: SDR family oxidoreductase [Hydrocarboniphaga]|jgi:all-trans-retinol dehydrogenase (NAD+)|uniref:Putative short chain dehydrogenase n=1 Tax=Hydrocarboniphaga effusa AP103 TaxID=1172194 RepID=I8TCX6_9GAMM|nr:MULTISPECIES: SDR family oxidoreductase [Hydrocarboniphaga]EIT71523.1 putative short chain dehydrogenase [Hydrocarboniphaga effusa AP103]MDZ4077487.1 SDR family oxidoreductase [Hydrocarboniphaga sp.]
MDSVAGKKVLITGAAMGMGRLYADLAVREKAAAVVLWDVNQAALDTAVAELKAAGGTVFAYTVDVSNLESIEQAAAQVQREAGDIDLLFNNAGIIRGKFFWEHDNRRDIWPTMAINTLAIMYIARAFLPAMIANKRESRIVNIASAAGTVANPRMSVYCASKWAAIGWSDSLRLELKQAGHVHVKVTTVCPSYISTGMFSGVKAPLLTPILTPEVVTNRVWQAMKAGKPLLTMPWTVRLAMLARGLLPLALWDFVADRIFGIYHSMDDFEGRPKS